MIILVVPVPSSTFHLLNSHLHHYLTHNLYQHFLILILGYHPPSIQIISAILQRLTLSIFLHQMYLHHYFFFLSSKPLYTNKKMIISQYLILLLILSILFPNHLIVIVVLFLMVGLAFHLKMIIVSHMFVLPIQLKFYDCTVYLV